MADQHPTLAEYDDRDQTTAIEPAPDLRVVALQALIDAETHREWAARSLARAQLDDLSAENRLEDARAAYIEAMAGTKLR